MTISVRKEKCENMANKENDALQVQNQSYMALADDNFGGMMAEEFDGLEVTFEKIKIPSGGGIVFELLNEDGEPDTVKDFSAVILYHHPLNCYYSTKYTGGNAPPDCGSFDGITGVGNPGGECKTCPLNQYESADEGKGKACKNRRRIYVLREGDVFPLLLSLPTGSLKEFTKYLQRLVTKKQKSNSLVTTFSLRKATNQGGVVYSQAQFAAGRMLTPEEFSIIEKMSAQVKEHSRNVGFVVDEGDSEVRVDPETGELL